MQIIIVLGLLILIVVLFAMEAVSVEILTLATLVVLVATRVLTPSEAFAGFGSEVIVILASIFVLSGALQQTGVVDAIGTFLYKIAASRPARVPIVLMASAGGVSAFMNNTTAAAIFVPIAMGLSKKAQISPSKLLMPLAFGSILGGTCTLIGTSTNVAVSGYLAKSGMKPLGLFETTGVGLTLLGAGILYMAIVGQHLLPAHRAEDQTEDYAIREYLTEIVVMPDSRLLGQRIFESDLSKFGFRILEVLRGSQKIIPGPETAAEKDDILLVEGRLEDLMKVKEATGIELKGDLKLGDLETEIKLAQALIMPQSDLIDRTLKEAGFRQLYGLVVLAIYRRGHSLRDKVGHIRLRTGDLLLIQGRADKLHSLRRNPNFWILEETNPSPVRRDKAIYASVLFVLAIAVGGVGWLPLSAALLSAAVLILLIRCITTDEAYHFIQWRLLILIGGMTAFGTAMEKTGAAQLLANWIVESLEPFGVTLILAGLFVLTIILTQPLSNAAAALVVLPIALDTARAVGANERTFAIGIMLVASISLIAPFEPACILVYSPGKYRFMDFVKTGIWLTIILAGIIFFLVPRFWPLYSSAT